jgi:tetratricopeptide (TPR) repeat protein
MLAETHYWLGNSLQVAGKFDLALPHLKEAHELAQRTGNKIIECRSLHDLTNTLISSVDTIGKVPEGLEESSRISTEIGDKLTSSHNAFWLGIYYNFCGEFSEAVEYLNQAVKLTQETGDTFYGLFSTFILGMALAGKGEFSEAISTLHQCLRRAQDSGSLYFVPRANNALGWVYHELSDIDRAILYNKKSLETAEAYVALPPALINLGADYFVKGDHVTARKYLQEAKNVLHLHQCVQWRYELKILQGFGGLSLAEGKYLEALGFVNDALIIAEKADAKKHFVKCLKLKAEILSVMNYSDEAFKTMQDALELAQKVGYPPLLWQTHYNIGQLLEKRGDSLGAWEHFATAAKLVEATASKIDDELLRNTIMKSPEMIALHSKNV